MKTTGTGLQILVVLLLITFFGSACRYLRMLPEWNQKDPKGRDVRFPHVPVDSNQLVLWKKPGISSDSFQRWINNTYPGALASTAFCANCDSGLALVTYPNIVSNPTGQTAHAGTTGPKVPPQGDNGPAYYSFNIPFVFNDSMPTAYFRNNAGSKEDVPFRSGSIAPLPFDKDSYNLPVGEVTVAVFDTGVDSLEMLNYLYQNSGASCLGAAAGNGWNFFNHNANWKDDYPTRHGSVVARFIHDQDSMYKNIIVNILPVKVHSSGGVSHLYDILCALQYAKDRKANIINASFGYYSAIPTLAAGEVDSASIFFRSFLKHYFNNSKMLMIASAGNKDDVNENLLFPGLSAADRRNLDKVNFFPASFAREIPNIISVTTVSESAGNVSPHQNFSSQVVDIGVNADVVDGSRYMFWNPRSAPNTYTVEGSSFATPIVTGKIAANYYLFNNILSGGALNKQHLLDTMVHFGLLHIADSSFSDKIKERRVTKKLR